MKTLLRPIINNIDKVICKQCAYFREHRGRSGLCTKFGEKNVITGEISYEYAYVSRANADLCRVRGLYYIEAHPTLRANRIQNK
jgi:hypothetical protein